MFRCRPFVCKPNLDKKAASMNIYIRLVTYTFRFDPLSRGNALGPILLVFCCSTIAESESFESLSSTASDSFLGQQSDGEGLSTSMSSDSNIAGFRSFAILLDLRRRTGCALRLIGSSECRSISAPVKSFENKFEKTDLYFAFRNFQQKTAFSEALL